MPENNSTAMPEERAARKRLLKRLFGLYEIIFIVLTALSVIGIGITDFSPIRSHRYWLAMIPVFACACLILEWSRARGKGQKWTTIVGTQLLLWSGLLLAVRMVYVLLHSGRLDNENTGLIILLLLALATFFAGIQLGWRLMILGIFLGLSLMGATYLEEYVWIYLFIAIVVVAILLLLKHYAGPKMEKKAE